VSRTRRAQGLAALVSLSGVTRLDIYGPRAWNAEAEDPIGPLNLEQLDVLALMPKLRVLELDASLVSALPAASMLLQVQKSKVGQL
jgi:hypothetical protein